MAPEVVTMTAPGATSDDKVAIMATPGFQSESLNTDMQRPFLFNVATVVLFPC